VISQSSHGGGVTAGTGGEGSGKCLGRGAEIFLCNTGEGRWSHRCGETEAPGAILHAISFARTDLPKGVKPDIIALMIAAIKKAAKRTLLACGLDVRSAHHTELPSIPDAEFYRPLFSPWLGYGEFAHYLELVAPVSLVSPDRIYVLYALALNAMRLRGEFWECGVYKGGTGRMLSELLTAQSDTRFLHLFDTFAGMPETDQAHDLHRLGDFSDTSLESVRRFVGDRARTEFHQGFIPDTFAPMENATIALAHIDVDIYRSIRDCCAFIYPRLVSCGIMVFDDYGFPSCPGAREAVDEFFRDKPETPLVLPTGQAIVMKQAA
jgi:O-methyltransferase